MRSQHLVPTTRRGLVAAALATAVLTGCDSGSEPEDEPRGAQRTTPPAAARPEPPPDGRALARGVTRERITHHLRALQRIADRGGGNRAAGTRGDRATIDYIAARLRDAGYRVRTQPVTFPFFRERAPARLAVEGRELARGSDFRTLEYSGSGRATGELRTIPRLGCADGDFAAVRRGEIAFVERGTCTFRSKARRAEEAGAAAVLVWDRAGGGEPPPGTLGAPGVRIPALVLSAAGGQRVAGGDQVRVAVDTVSERRSTSNVIAEPPGTTGRVVMAGGHLDSVAEGPGLNDNGSGVAAVLAVAESLRARALPVRFGFWGAEELGLIGSRRYVRGLSRAERRRIAAYLNLDMVGSPRPQRAVYDGDDRIERVLRRRLARFASAATGDRDLGRGSDHASFQRAGIAVGGLFTGAGPPADPCYHRRCDTIRNVNRGVVTEMAKTLAAALPALAPR